MTAQSVPSQLNKPDSSLSRSGWPPAHSSGHPRRAVRKSGRRRRGAATIELAVCLPVLLVIVFGAIECTTMMFVTQAAHVVAYEGVRHAIQPNATAAATLTRCNQVIAERKLRNCRVELLPAGLEALTRGEPITVQVVVPTGTNSILPLKFFSGNLTARASMVKE